jgi:DNA-binding protein HU-beta
MNKQELCNQLARQTKMSKARCMTFIDATFNAIEGSLKKGQQVRLVGFGSWRKVRRKSRPGRNPQTGKSLTIAARNVAKFTMGQHLYDQLN